MHCASCIGHKNHVIRRISARILRTRYYSWTSTVGDLYFFSNTLIDTLKLEKLKKFIKKKKIWLKPCTKPVTRWCNHDLENNDSRNVLSRSCLKLGVFLLRLYVKLFHALERISTYQVFFLWCYFKTLAFSHHEMYREPMKCREWIHKSGMFSKHTSNRSFYETFLFIYNNRDRKN